MEEELMKMKNTIHSNEVMKSVSIWQYVISLLFMNCELQEKRKEGTNSNFPGKIFRSSYWNRTYKKFLFTKKEKGQNFS